MKNKKTMWSRWDSNPIFQSANLAHYPFMLPPHQYSRQDSNLHPLHPKCSAPPIRLLLYVERVSTLCTGICKVSLRHHPFATYIFYAEGRVLETHTLLNVHLGQQSSPITLQVYPLICCGKMRSRPPNILLFPQFSRLG